MLWDPPMEHTREAERLNYFYHWYYWGWGWGRGRRSWGGAPTASCWNTIVLSLFFELDVLCTWFLRLKYSWREMVKWESRWFGLLKRLFRDICSMQLDNVTSDLLLEKELGYDILSQHWIWPMSPATAILLPLFPFTWFHNGKCTH